MAIIYEQLDTPAKRTGKQSSYFTTLVRNLRLHIFQQISPFAFRNEQPKVAIFRDRGIAALHFLLHILPLTAVALLIILNLVTYHVGEVSSTSLTALQFAAKSLEMLMQLSLTTILLAFLRNRMLVCREPVAFGGLLAPYRITSLSYLWSLEFWGAVTSFTPWTNFKVAFCMLVPLFVILAALVGPSSAILLIPRIGYYHDANLIAYMGPSNSIYPNSFDLVQTSDVGNAGSLIAEQDFNHTVRSLYAFHENRGLSLAISDLSVSMNQNSRMLQTLVFGKYHTGNTQSLSVVATVPTQLITRIFSDEITFQDGGRTFTASSYQPYASMRCSRPVPCPTDIEYVNFGPSVTELNRILPMSSFRNITNENRTVSKLYSDVDIEIANTTTIWASQIDHSAIFATRSKFGDANQSNNCPLGCTVDAYWIKMKTEIASRTHNVENEDLNELMYGTDNSYRVQLSLKLLMRIDQITRTLLPLMEEESNEEVPDSLLRSIAPAIALMMSSSSIVPSDMRLNKTDASVGSQFWSRVSNDDAVNDKSWLRRDGVKYDQAVAHFNTSTVFNRSEIGVVTTNAYFEDYRYDSEDTTVRLSLAVMFAYVLAVLIYLIYSLVTGHTATSWDSVADLVTLALNSQQPDGFDNTSVGVQTLNIFRKPVKIRVAENEACELVFPSQGNTSKRSFQDVKANEMY